MVINNLYHISNAKIPKNLFTYFTSNSEESICFWIHSLFIHPSFTTLESQRNSLHNEWPWEFQRLIVLTLNPNFSEETKESCPFFFKIERNGNFPTFVISSYLYLLGMWGADKIKSSLVFLKNKAKTLEDIYNNSKYIIQDKVTINKDDLKLLDDKAKKVITEFSNNISSIEILNKENLEPIINGLIKSHETNFKGVGQPLRIILTGSKFGPGIYDIITSLGKKEVMKRLSFN